MVKLEEYDEDNNVIATTNNGQTVDNENINNLPNQFQPFFHTQQTPVFLPNMLPQFQGMPFSFNIQMNPNAPPQSFPPNMFIFKHNN
jgi:hypothetical protein